MISRFASAFNGLIDDFGDPARRRRAALTVCVAYGALWFVYAVIAKSSQDLNADMAEMIVWTREMALGYPKHPPVLAWVLWAWFKIFPLTDWAYFLLSAVTLSAGIFLVIELSAEWLQRDKLALVPFLLATIPFYNFLGLKWDQNSVLIPLWALAMWAMLRALDTRHLGWAALAALASAAAMLSKYWSGFLLVALALAALVHPKRALYFRSAAPWVTAGLFIAAVAPHVWWLVVNDFPPINWVATRRVAGSFAETLASLGETVGGTIAYCAVALALVMIFVRPSFAALKDSLLPRDERRVPATLFWTPLLLPVVPALLKNIRLLSLWNTPALNLLPVMLLASPLVTVTRLAALRIAGIVTVLMILIVAASPFIAYVIFRSGVENNAAYARLVMDAAQREWEQATDKPLKMLAGPFVLVSTAAFYGKDRPSTFANFSKYLSPWADDERLRRDGMAIMCDETRIWCQGFEEVATRYGGATRRTEVALARRWLGFENAPRRFIVLIVPPR